MYTLNAFLTYLDPVTLTFTPCASPAPLTLNAHTLTLPYPAPSSHAYFTFNSQRYPLLPNYYNRELLHRLLTEGQLHVTVVKKQVVKGEDDSISRVYQRAATSVAVENQVFVEDEGI